MIIRDCNLEKGGVFGDVCKVCREGASLGFGLAGPDWRTRVIRTRVLCPYQAVKAPRLLDITAALAWRGPTSRELQLASLARARSVCKISRLDVDQAA